MRKTYRAEVVAAAGAQLGEGPAWDASRRRLLWVDIPAGAVHLLDPSTGEDRTVEVAQPVGAVVPDSSGGLVVAVRDGFGRIDLDERFELMVDLSRPGFRMNDGKCAPDGSLWAGTMAEDAASSTGVLYRLDADWAGCEATLDGLTISNGMAWTPDGGRMYFIDTPTRRVDVFDTEPGTPLLANRRTLLRIPDGAGNPDGMTIDEEGCLWVALAHSGRVQRYLPDGTPDTVVEIAVPQVTSCCFGGDRGEVLFMTSGRRGAEGDPLAGAVFACTPGVAGAAAVPYRSSAA